MEPVRRDGFTDSRAPGDPLLGPDDPPPYEIVNPRGPSPVVFLCDHASNRVPEGLDNLGLSEAELAGHIGWDIGAGELTRHLARYFDAPAVLAGYSRLVVDCNRHLHDDGAFLAVSDGVAVPGNAGLSEQDKADRAEACYWPYHEACSAVIEGVEARGDKVPVVIMMHSFTPAMGREPRPWQIGILWDGDGDARMALPLLGFLRNRGDLCVGDNEPYSGASPYGYTMPAHAGQAGRANIQIEIRQDQIGDHAGIARWADIMAEAFGHVLADPAVFRRGG